MRPQHLFFLALIVSAAAIFYGCPTNPVTPHAETTISEAGGTLTLGDAAIDIDAEALPSSVRVELTQDAEGEEVEHDENETPVSDVFTLEHNQEVVIDCANGAFRITLPFDSTGIAKDSDLAAKVFVKMDTDEDIFTIIGDVDGETITIELIGLPNNANFQVVYNPNGEFLDDEDPADSKLLTTEPPWPTSQWRLHVDATNSVLRTAVATVLGVSESSVTREQVLQVLRDRVSRKAKEVATQFQAMGLRQPNVPIYTRPDGKKRFMLNIVNQRNYYENPAHEYGVGQIHIACPVIGWAPSYFLGTAHGVIAHETFHACVNGYGLKMGKGTTKKWAFGGYNEGMATVVGHTIDEGNVISVRENIEGRDYSLKLDNPLCIHDPRKASYTNNDFFAYVAKRYGGGSLAYLVGTGEDEDGYKTGVLDQIRKYVLGDPLMHPWSSPLDSYLIGYRKGLHNAIFEEFDQSLATVYWDFARNRAYENNPESVLRASDSTIPWNIQQGRFTSTGYVERAFTSDSQVHDLLLEPALTDIPPLSTRAIVFTGSGFEATLTLTIDVSTWKADEVGNSVKVKTYEAGSDGVELGASGVVEFDGFGAAIQQVVVIVSNLNMEDLNSVDLIAETEPVEEPPVCSPDLPNDRWLIEYDLDCDGSYDSDDLWHLETGGAVRDHFLGVIEDYSWSFVEGRLIVSFGPGRGTMEGTMNEDCLSIDDGVFVGDFARDTCWRAHKQ